MVDSSSNLSAPAPHPISWDSSPKNSNKNTPIETQTNAKNHWFPIFIFIFVWGFFWSNAIFLAFQTILLTYYLFLIPPPDPQTENFGPLSGQASDRRLCEASKPAFATSTFLLPVGICWIPMTDDPMIDWFMWAFCLRKISDLSLTKGGVCQGFLFFAY